MEDFGIYIPSRGRSHLIQKGALAQLPKQFLKKTYVVVSLDEQEQYESVVPRCVTVLGIDVKGIAFVRQWILENAREPYILFVSDDIRFSYRIEEDGKLKLRPSGDLQMVSLFQELYGYLMREYVHVGVSQRAFNHTSAKDYVEIARMNDVYAYNRKLVLAAGARFDVLPVMEDFDITLSLLELGYPNIVTHRFAWNQRKSGEEGGCSTYRDWRMQRDAAFALATRHPGCVNIVSKKSKVGWANIGESRVDVNIQWKKAYRPQVSRIKAGVTNFFGVVDK